MSTLKLERRVDGQVWALRNGDARPVHVYRCFPWSEPGRFVSLRDTEEQELAMVFEPAELDPDSRRVLEGALAEAGFVLEVTAIQHVEDEVEIRTWRVDTRHGPRTFQTRLDDWPRDVPGGGLLIRDVAGDLYHVPDPSALDSASRALLWAYSD